MRLLTWIWKNILCRLSFHKWGIGLIVDYKGKFKYHYRECEICWKKQNLVRPKKYHPSKYVWENSKVYK